MRLPHCTLTFMGHSPACDRDGQFCSRDSSHPGPCTPHGVPSKAHGDHDGWPDDGDDRCEECLADAWSDQEDRHFEMARERALPTFGADLADLAPDGAW